MVLAAQPHWWPWIVASFAANHAALGAVGMWPRSRLLGPNLVRLPEPAAARGEIALTFDDGPDPDVTPRVLDLLDRAGARATFFCVGDRVARLPDLAAEIVRRGHTIENHSQRHTNGFAAYGPAKLRAEILAAQQAIEAATGRAPAFFRAPMGLRSPMLDPVLARLALRQVSWTRRGFDSVERDPAKVHARLVRNLAAGDILLLHDGGFAARRGREPIVLSVLPRLLEQVQAAGLRCVSLAAACGPTA